MCAQEGECGLRFKATVPGVYKWSFFAVTKLGEDCPEEPTGFNRFGTCLNSVQMSFKVVYKYPLALVLKPLGLKPSSDPSPKH